MSGGVAILTGLRFEASLLRRQERASLLTTALSGARADGARAAMASLLKKRPRILVSFGIAGGLRPGLGAGTLLLPRRVVTGGEESLATDESLRRIVKRSLPSGVSCVEAPLVGADEVVSGYEEKSALGKERGAVAVDMESHVVALAARAHKLPFIVVRAVADAIEDDFPQAALAALTVGDGAIHMLPFMRELMRRPQDIAAVARLAWRCHVALSALRRVAPALSLL